MKKPEYLEGPAAREKFENGMTKLFQAPKDAVKEKPKRLPKRKKASKD
jgi:ssDNA-specific exonuclease RecJ